MLNPKLTAAAFGAALALSGCMTAPQKIYGLQQPQTAPVRNLTSMDLALSCLDRQLAARNLHGFKKLTSTGIPNRAGDKVSLNSGVDMLKTTIGQLSRSNAFRYIDLASLAPSTGGMKSESAYNPLDQFAIQKWAEFLSANRVQFLFPDYIITGSVSQADSSVASDRVTGGIDGGGADAEGGIGASANQSGTVVTVDMQLEDAATLQMVNGMTTRNSIVVLRSGVGADLSGRVHALGAHFSVNLDRSEGIHQAIRILIQLGTIELLGRLAGVPYEQCLTGDTVQAAAPGRQQDDFDGLSDADRLRYAQRILALVRPEGPGTAPYFQGAADGLDSPALRSAIAAYQRDAGLVPSGRVDLDFYRSLKHRADTTPAARPALVAALTPPPVAMQPPRLGFSLPGGQRVQGASEFALGSSLRFNVDVDRDAYVECFLRNQDQRIYRIFPNIDQADARVAAGRAVAVPGEASRTQIVLDAPTREEVACISSDQPLRAGAEFEAGPLGSTVLPLSTLTAVLDYYRRQAGGAALGWETWRFEVK